MICLLSLFYTIEYAHHISFTFPFYIVFKTQCVQGWMGKTDQFPMMLHCLCVWVADRGEAKGWLRSRNLSENPDAERQRGWKWMYVYVLPGHAWCTLMAHTCAHWAAERDSICSGTSRLCMCQHECVCLFYFPCCLMCGWLIAFRVLTESGAWLSI